MAKGSPTTPALLVASSFQESEGGSTPAAALREREEELRDFMENANVGLHRMGRDGTILWVNRAELRLLGYAEDEYVGRSMATFHVDQGAIADMLARLARGEEILDRKARLWAKDGSIKHVLISSSACFRGGEFVHTRCFTHDITARHEVEQARCAAVALENARLHRETENGRARAEQLNHFAQAVVAADKVEVVFDAALAVLAAAIGASRAAILIFDSEGVMRFKAWRNLSEKYRGAVEGHSPWSRDAVAPEPVLVPDVDTEPSLEAFLPLFREEGIGSLGFIPLVTRGRLIGKFMVYYRDVHEYSPGEVELATAIASHVASVTARFAAITKLEETIRYNDLFAGVLAHDLRNPLGAIMAMAHVAMMEQVGSQDDGNTNAIGRIITSGQRMTRMIDQLLDVTRARAGGGIDLELSETNLAHLCAQAIGEVQLAFPHWTVKREGTGQFDGRWDPDRVLQIVSNLVSNAGQHGRPDGVVTVRLDGRDPDAVILEVHNDGSIPASIMPSLFDPFRGTRSLRETSRGLGLGLFIVKEITEAHGGTVTVVSSADEGTTFAVRLPRRPSVAPAPW